MVDDAAPKLGILSIFLTVDGECNKWGPGTWSVFIRTRGCTVACRWCDTKYSWPNKGGEVMRVQEIINRVFEIVDGRIPGKVTITGGEPLEQDWHALTELIGVLRAHGVAVTVETAGTQNTYLFRETALLPLDQGVCFVVDYKLKGSKFVGKMDLEGHFMMLRPWDVIKMVIDSKEDFDEACEVVSKLTTNNNFKTRIYFSPSHNNVSPQVLFQWMKDSRELTIHRGVGINLQLHKYIFPDDMREEEESGYDYTKRTLGREEYLERMHKDEGQ